MGDPELGPNHKKGFFLMGDVKISVPGLIVKKANSLIRQKLALPSQNATSLRILACLVACIRADDKNCTQTYKISVSSILPEGEKHTAIYSIGKEAVDNLAQARFTFEDIINKTYSAKPFFQDITYKDGYISAIFNQLLSDMLFKLKQFFTTYNLVEYIRLKSVYSMKLFEILKSYESLGEVTISMTDLHEWLDTPKACKADFRQFRIYVLEKAHKDIHEKTEFRFEWQAIKAGRSVEAIKFSFGRKKLAITQKENDKAKEEKRRRLENQRFLRAWDCASGKKGQCQAQDNKPIICKLCLKIKMQDEARRKAAEKAS